MLCRECRYITLCEHRRFHIHQLPTVKTEFLYFDYILYLFVSFDIQYKQRLLPWTPITSSNYGGDAVFPVVQELDF
jgi:hypothetical protein